MNFQIIPEVVYQIIKEVKTVECSDFLFINLFNNSNLVGRRCLSLSVSQDPVMNTETMATEVRRFVLVYLNIAGSITYKF